MAVITRSYEFTSCKDCPELCVKNAFDGMDGRTSALVYVCKEGVFGKAETGNYSGYYTGPKEIPKIPPYGCRHIKSNKIDRLASNLNISTTKLISSLNEEHVILLDKDASEYNMYLYDDDINKFIISAKSKEDAIRILKDKNIKLIFPCVLIPVEYMIGDMLFKLIL